MNKKITFLIFLVFALFLLSNIPYINLVLTTETILFIIYLTVLFVYKIKPKINIILGILLIIISLPWLLIGNRIRPEFLGVIAFILILIGLIQEAWVLRKKLK